MAGASESEVRPKQGKFARGLNHTANWLAALALAAVLLFTTSQVLDRYFFKSAFNAHDQLARIALVALAFVGIAIGIRDRVNVRIEVLAHLAAPRMNRIVQGVLTLITWGLALVLLVTGIRLLDIGASQPILGTVFTYRVMYASLLIGMALLVAFLSLRVLYGWRRRLSGRTPG